MKYQPLVLVLLGILTICFSGCSQEKELIGKWEGAYLQSVFLLDKAKMEYILNIQDNRKYTITTRIQHAELSKPRIYSQEYGIWSIKQGIVFLIPKTCKQANEEFYLIDENCLSRGGTKFEFNDGMWEFAISKTKKLKLNKRQG